MCYKCFFVLNVVTWNVNSINMRKDQVIELSSSFEGMNDDTCIMLQELKCVNEKFPDSFNDLFKNIIIHGQKRYNGVAVLTNKKVNRVEYTFDNNPCADESRYLEVEIDDNVVLISVYVPNGTSIKHENFGKKLLFLDSLKNRLDYLNKCGKIVVIGGDFNVAPFDIDVYSASDMRNTLSFTVEEKVRIKQILNIGFVDFFRIKNYNKKEFSWWDYRGSSLQNNTGLRIDYILCNKSECFVSCRMLKHTRFVESPSDHIPVQAVIKYKRGFYE